MCIYALVVLELCCFEWFQNSVSPALGFLFVLELCCFEWFQNSQSLTLVTDIVLELCCFEWFQNHSIGFTKSSVGFRAVLFRMVPKP